MYILNKKVVYKYRYHNEKYKTLKIVACSDIEYIYFDTVIFTEDKHHNEKCYTVNKIDYDFNSPVCTVYLENHNKNFIKFTA